MLLNVLLVVIIQGINTGVIHGFKQASDRPWFSVTMKKRYGENKKCPMVRGSIWSCLLYNGKPFMSKRRMSNNDNKSLYFSL